MADLCEVCTALGCSPPSLSVSAAHHSPRWRACRLTDSVPPAHENLFHTFLNTARTGVSLRWMKPLAEFGLLVTLLLICKWSSERPWKYIFGFDQSKVHVLFKSILIIRVNRVAHLTHSTPFSVVPLCPTGLEVAGLLAERPLQGGALIRWHDGESFIWLHETHHWPLLAACTTFCRALRHVQHKHKSYRFNYTLQNRDRNKGTIKSNVFKSNCYSPPWPPVVLIPGSRGLWTTQCDSHRGRCCRPESLQAARCRTPPGEDCWCGCSGRGRRGSGHPSHIQQSTEEISHIISCCSRTVTEPLQQWAFVHDLNWKH